MPQNAGCIQDLVKKKSNEVVEFCKADHTT